MVRFHGNAAAPSICNFYRTCCTVATLRLQGYNVLHSATGLIGAWVLSMSHLAQCAVPHINLGLDSQKAKSTVDLSNVMDQNNSCLDTGCGACGILLFARRCPMCEVPMVGWVTWIKEYYYEKIYFEAYTNDKHIWHKNNIAQLYFILGRAKLCWNFSIVPKNAPDIHIFPNRKWVLTMRTSGKSVNIRSTPKKHQTILSFATM